MLCRLLCSKRIGFVFAAIAAPAGLSSEIITAGREYLGRPAIYHQHFSTDCWPGNDTAASCLDRGLGADEYDCSGFVIAAVSAAAGLPTADWPAELRHVRQMWRDAEQSQVRFRQDALAVGNLLVTAHTWRTEGGAVRLPGHIGIITGFTDEAVPVVLQASARQGMVIEKPLASTANLVGAVTVTA